MSFPMCLKNILLLVADLAVVFDLWRILKETTKASKDYFSFQWLPIKLYKLPGRHTSKTRIPNPDL